MTRRITLASLALVFLTALAVWTRVQFVALYGGHDADYVRWAIDHYFGQLSAFYLEAADRIAQGKDYGTTLYPPGYPAFLAALKSAGLATALQFRHAQLAIDSAGVVLMFAVARWIGLSLFWGLVAAAAYAVHPLFAGAGTFLLADSLSSVLVLAALAALVWAARGLALWRWLVPGGVVGAAGLVRPDLLLVAAPAAVWLMFTERRAVALRRAVAFAAGIMLFIGPWGIHNRTTNGAWLFTSSGGGSGLWQGLGDFPNAHGYIVSDSAMAARVRAQGLVGESIEADRFLRQSYLSALREHPGHVARMAALRWKAILFSSERLQPLFFARVRIVMDVVGAWLCVVALVVYRRNVAALAAIGLPVLHALSGIGLVHYEARYVRYVHLSYIFASIALADVCWRAFSERWPRLVMPFACVFVAIAAVYVVRELRDLSSYAGAAAHAAAAVYP